MNSTQPQNKPPKAIQIFLTFFFSIAGMTLLFCSIFLPPKGEIHPSILVAFAQILTFVAVVLGIDYKYKVREFELFNLLKSHDRKQNGNIDLEKPKQNDY